MVRAGKLKRCLKSWKILYMRTFLIAWIIFGMNNSIYKSLFVMRVDKIGNMERYFYKYKRKEEK